MLTIFWKTSVHNARLRDSHSTKDYLVLPSEVQGAFQRRTLTWHSSASGCPFSATPWARFVTSFSCCLTWKRKLQLNKTNLFFGRVFSWAKPPAHDCGWTQFLAHALDSEWNQLTCKSSSLCVCASFRAEFNWLSDSAKTCFNWKQNDRKEKCQKRKSDLFTMHVCRHTAQFTV